MQLASSLPATRNAVAVLLIIPALLIAVGCTPPAADTTPEQEATIPTDADVTATSFFDHDHGWLTTSDQRLFKTSDGGGTWTAVSSIEHTVRDLHFVSVQHGWALTQQRLLQTNDGGETWEAVHRDLQSDGITAPFAMEFADGQHGWLQDSHAIYSTNDSGQSWRPLPAYPCPEDSLSPFSLISRDTAWVLCGFSGGSGFMSKRLYRTDDGGENWTLLAEALVGDHREPWAGEDDPGGLSIGDYVSTLFLLDEEHGWHGTQRAGEVWRTTDGGTSWEPMSRPISPQVGQAVLKLQFVSPERGVMLIRDGSRVVLLGTHDAGETWDPVLDF